MTNQKGLNAYQSVAAHSGTMEADPHKLIQMLLEGALSKLRLAKGYVEQNNIHDKGINISLALAMVEALQCSLDRERGGEIATNLFEIYDYVQRILLQANLENHIGKIDEAINIITTIKEGWDQIR